MFDFYTDRGQEQSAHPQVAATGATLAFSTIKTKLVVFGHADADVTLTPRLHFASFLGLKEQIEALLRCLPRAKNFSLVSLQYLDADGDMVDLLPSTFDPEDFTDAPRVIMRAKVDAKPKAALPRTKNTDCAGVSRKAPSRRVFGVRDTNIQLSAAPPSMTANKTRRERPVNGGADAVRHEARRTPLSSTRAPIAPASGRSLLQSEIRRKDSEKAQGSRSCSGRYAAQCSAVLRVPKLMFETEGVGSRRRKDSEKAQGSRSCSGRYAAQCSAVLRVPKLMFETEGVGSRTTTTPGTNNAVPTALVAKGLKPRPIPSPSASGSSAVRSCRGRQQHASVTAPKPSWNFGNRPAWEEAEKRKTDRRNETRTRILRKRAALAAKKAGGKAARVIKRAKRDCRVTDARRQRLGSPLFHDLIGTPPSALGKRKLEPYREFGRAAVAAMRFVPIPDGERMPKRGRGCGEGAVIYPRGDTVSTGLASSEAQAKNNRLTSATLPKIIDGSKKAVAVPESNVGRGSKRSAARSALSSAPASRSGDIHCRGVRPPLAPSLSRRGGGKPESDAKSSGGNRFRARKGASALTAAAAAKATAAPDPPSWSGRLRSSASPARTHAWKGHGGGRSGARKGEVGRAAACDSSAKTGPGGGEGDEEGARSAAVAKAIMAKLARGGVVGGDVEALQEQVALLKAAAGLSDEELTWRMETAKPEANAYRIASAALERTETAYDRLLWRQGQLQIAYSRLAGKNARGGEPTTSPFLAAMARVTGGASDEQALSRLRSSAETILAELPAPAPSGGATAAAGGTTSGVWPADEAARSIRAAAERMVRLTAAVESTARTGSEIDRAVVVGEVVLEVETLADRAKGVDRDLRTTRLKAEEALGRVESWQQRRAEAPEFAAEEAAREEGWSQANREANQAALREMRSLLPEAVWDMNAAEIQAAAAMAAVARGQSDGQHFFYPSDLCVRLRECRPLHWLVSAPEDIANANFLAGEGAAAFTQLEAMDLTEMRAVWCVLPKEFARDADGKKAEWRSRFRLQLEGMVRQEERAVVTAGWDPVRGRRATCRMLPLPAHRARNPAYFYPTVEAARARVEKSHKQQRRLDARKTRLSELEVEIAEAKAEVDSACADARSAELRKQYGPETLRNARETAKKALSALVLERKTLVSSVAEAERKLSAAYPSMAQLESEANSLFQILSRCPAQQNSREGGDSVVRVPGAFAFEPELRRRTAAAARKLTPEEERASRACEVQQAVSSRNALPGSGSADANASADPPLELGKTVADVGALAAAKAVSEVTFTLATAASADGKEGEAEASAEHSAGGRPLPGRVRVAPSVLAFLEKDCRAKTATAAREGEERKGGAEMEASAEHGAGGHPLPGRVRIASSVLAFLEKDCRAKTVTAAREGEERKGGAEIAPKAVVVCGSAKVTPTDKKDVLIAPREPTPRAKPISKSLAALIARGGGGCGDGRVGAVGGRTDKPALLPPPPQRGFLEELKKRANRSNAALEHSQGGADVADGQSGVGESGGSGGDGRGESSHNRLRSRVGKKLGTQPSALPKGLTDGRPGSFLDELKARTAMVD